MTNPTNEHREQALQIAIEAEREFMAAKDDVGKYRPKQTTALAQRIASALSSRDTEIREVLEGFKVVDCWCDDGAMFNLHSKRCLATQVLYAKLQPLPSENPGDTVRE